MKLLYCRLCGDVVALKRHTRLCACQATGGQYIDLRDAVYWGDAAVPLGFHNASFKLALQNQPESGMGEVFEAFVIPKNCPTMRKITAPSEAHAAPKAMEGEK